MEGRRPMKQKVTISIDADLLPAAKQHAAEQGVSLSSLVEHSLMAFGVKHPIPFATRWRGKFKPAEGDPPSDAEVDELRYEALARKYLR